MFYMLPSKTASFEGELMGERTFVYSTKRREVESSLKESLVQLAEMQERINELEQKYCPRMVRNREQQS